MANVIIKNENRKADAEHIMKTYKITMQDFSETLQSYLGMLEHCNSDALINKILDEIVLTHNKENQEEGDEPGGIFGSAEYDHRESEIYHF